METTPDRRTLLSHTLERSLLSGLPPPVRGKVRDVYDLGDRLLIITTDRISAFDVVLGTIPCKGQVLNTIAAHWFDQTADLVPNHVLAVPDPCAMLVRKLKPISIEVVVRRYMTGSLWRDYQAGRRDQYGIRFPDNLRNDERFSELILTPTTKAEQGEHDAPISAKEILQRGLVSKSLWEQIEQAAFALFRRGEERAKQCGLLLVDTKYEFGLDTDRLLVMDEIHTPDSSRYWEMDSYDTRFEQGLPQQMLDKENIRQWLLQRGFSGQGTPPALTDEIRLELAEIYVKLQLRLTGKAPAWPERDPAQRLAENLHQSGIL